MITDSAKKIFLASDHAGFELKSKIFSFLQSIDNLDIVDLGCENSIDSVDYPDYCQKLCNNLKDCKKDSFGILICGSGIGMSIGANRYSFVRAALCCNEELAKLSRNHNNANVLCLGARFVDEELAFNIVKTFLTSNFDGGRHESRIQKLS